RFMVLLLNSLINFFPMNIDILRRIDPDLYLFSFDCQHFNFNIFTDLDSFVTLPCQNKHYASPFSLWVATVAIGALIGNASSFSMYCLPIFVRELMITGACKFSVLFSKGSFNVTIDRTTTSRSCSMARLFTI